MGFYEQFQRNEALLYKAPVVKANGIGLTFELMFVQTLCTMPNTVVKKFKVKSSYIYLILK